MKKYEKPAIEVVEANLSADYLLGASDTQGGDPEFAPGKKGSSDIDEDDNGFSEGW